MSSVIPNVLNFKENDIDWLQCHKNALSSYTIKACELYKDGYSIKKISTELHLSPSTIVTYLKKGTSINLCDYKIYDNSDIYCLLHKIKPFKCDNTGDTFFDVVDCVTQSESLFGVKLSKSSINRILNGTFKQTKGYRFTYINKD